MVLPLARALVFTLANYFWVAWNHRPSPQGHDAMAYSSDDEPMNHHSGAPPRSPGEAALAEPIVYQLLTSESYDDMPTESYDDLPTRYR